MPSCNDRLGTILNKFPLFRGNLSINCSIIDLPPLAKVLARASCGSQCVPYSYGRSLIWLFHLHIHKTEKDKEDDFN